MLNINDGIKEFRKNKNAVLLDVRTKKEYNYGNIKGSVNIPVQLLERVSRQIVDKHIEHFSLWFGNKYVTGDVN